MSEGYRGDPREQTAISKFWRGRFPYGSLLVLDIDRVVCRSDLAAGILFEEKHSGAKDKTWRVTRELASRLGWRAALLEYETDGGLYGEVAGFSLTLSLPGGLDLDRLSLQPRDLDAWITETLDLRRAA